MESLVRSYLRPAYAVALAVVGRPSDAEDIAQDAFVRAMQRLDTCRDGRCPLRWKVFLQHRPTSGVRRHTAHRQTAPRRTLPHLRVRRGETRRRPRLQLDKNRRTVATPHGDNANSAMSPRVDRESDFLATENERRS